MRANSREHHWAWKGGHTKSPEGYMVRTLPRDHPLISMAHKGRNAWQTTVLEHRLVMAEHLGRVLERYETVHHINGQRDDNRIENLQLRVGRHGKGVIARCRDCKSRSVEYVPLDDVGPGEQEFSLTSLLRGIY